ncbi:MAG: deoxyguanosinetriphosphate triphosphohydrolase [Verrucomicrobiota bacterium]|nr:deoxyguanosinetriphosphate triphosphohydrolase [Verrucomicrobiota bacterium]
MTNDWIAKTRLRIENEECNNLSQFGQYNSDSAGRKHQEPPHPFRTAFQRDRARIIHSRAFRRLEYKTQVFLNGTGDHLRTRLTHTIEVASVSRTIACALGVNQDLTEAISLAHDLGHPPFGHTGEKKLNEIMLEDGGFEHNIQSLRVVELLETLYPNFDGLNLSYEVLEGIRKHDKGYCRSAYQNKKEENFPNPSIEAQIANLADEITYYSHDLDDGLNHKLINEKQLNQITLWQQCANFVGNNYPALKDKRRRSYIIRTLIDCQVADLISATSEYIQNFKFDSSDAIRRHPERLVRHSEKTQEGNQQLKKFLYENLYHHEQVAMPNARGGNVIAKIFSFYEQTPNLIGEESTKRISSEGLKRTICDYVSGMTDRYVLEEYDRLRKM